jgi:hypothetical protein
MCLGAHSEVLRKRYAECIEGDIARENYIDIRVQNVPEKIIPGIPLFW